MASNAKVAELRATAKSNEWEDMLSLYCQASAVGYIRLAREVSELSMKMNAKNRERGILIAELATYVGQRVPQKTAQFLMELQYKDEGKVMELEGLAADMELRSKEIDVFIQRLKGMLPL